MSWGPHRIVCLSTETVDLLYRLGVEDRIVGVSGYTVFPPQARSKPFVSAYTTIRYETVESLRPDLVLAFSDLQAEAAAVLARRGYPVLLTNQRSLEEVLETMVLVGRAVGKPAEAECLAGQLRRQLDDARRLADQRKRRPRVYFEEWNDPLITGIAWVSELIEAAGGEDVFADRRDAPAAKDRIVPPAEVINRAPEVIVASWCGKKANLDSIAARDGWNAIPAVAEGRLFDLPSAYCLQPGPALFTEGLPRLQEIVRTRDDATNGNFA